MCNNSEANSPGLHRVLHGLPLLIHEYVCRQHSFTVVGFACCRVWSRQSLSRHGTLSRIPHKSIRHEDSFKFSLGDVHHHDTLMFVVVWGEIYTSLSNVCPVILSHAGISLGSIKLDSRNKEKMHNFYDVLLKRFRRVGSQTGKLSSTEQQEREKQLNFLSG